MPKTSAANVIAFDRFRLNVHSREVRIGDRVIRLQEQPFHILRLLLEGQGRVVTRDELRCGIWSDDTFVDFEHSLNAAIKRLRAAIGDTAEAPQYVETVPRCGYRLVRSEPSTTRDHVRVAVRTFQLVNESSRMAGFGTGLVEDVVTELVRRAPPSLAIVARSAVAAADAVAARARDAGEALNADYLIEGSIRLYDGCVRIVARLVSSFDEVEVWSNVYDGPETDPLATQGRVARDIAGSTLQILTARNAEG